MKAHEPICVVDSLAGDWPTRSFVKLFGIAQKCVAEKMTET